MFELILLAVAFIGSLLAGLWDLKTTEIPDEIPTLMIGLAIPLWLISGNLYGLALSVVFGLAFLGFGWLLYRAGQWGGGDAKLLSAIGFLLPTMGSRFFALDFLFNLFFVGLFYMVAYSLALGFLNPGTFSKFGRSMTREKTTAALLAVLLIAALVTYLIDAEFLALSTLLIIAALLVIFWKYSKTVEDNIFKKKIPVAKLRIGDVLLDSKQWDGIGRQELEKIKRSGKRFVVIKEGVRFGMVFCIAVVVTYLFGNLMFFFVGI